MAGEIAEQHLHITARGKGSQQQVAVEQGIGRLSVTNVGRTQATGVRHLVEHRLGHALFVEQVMVMPGDLVALLQYRGMQATQAVHGADLGAQDHGAVGLGHEIVAAGLQAAHQASSSFNEVRKMIGTKASPASA